MINKIKYRIIILLILAVFTGCQDDDMVPANVDAIVAESGDLLNQAFPLTQVRVEGQGLNGLRKITLDNKIDVTFNPNYNSDGGFIFTIPFDDALGSRFGVQPITFQTANGSVTKDIEILHPVPTIVSTIPAVPTPGFPLEIEGTWFYDVSSITLGGKAVSYSVNSSSSIIIGLPADAVSGSELIITTPGGTAIKTVEFVKPAIIVVISDFDNGGVRNEWSSYGDVDTFNASTTGGPTGNYATFSWTGSTANGYNGSSGGGGANFLDAASKDATKAYIDIDVSANVVGAHVAIQINTIEGINYGYNFKITDVDWSTKSILLADFKDNYGYGGNPATALDVSKVNEIKIGIAQGDTPNPSIIKYDNIKIRYE